MAKFITVEATITDLAPAKKGRYAGKKRHDVLVLRPEGNDKVEKSLLPEYAQTMLAEGKKVVMYKTNKAYASLVQALFPEQDSSSEELELEVASTPSIEDVQAEAEARNEQMNAILRSNMPKVVKEALISKL